MRFAGPEGTVEITRRAAAALHTTTDEAKSLVEGACELGWDNVVFDCLRSRSIGHALCQLEDEIIGLNPVRDMDQITKQRARVAHATALRPRPRRTGAGGAQARRSSTVRPSSRACSST